MSDVKRIATRTSYGNALVELGKEHELECIPRKYEKEYILMTPKSADEL